jgi:hypothetical protein
MTRALVSQVFPQAATFHDQVSSVGGEAGNERRFCRRDVLGGADAKARLFDAF